MLHPPYFYARALNPTYKHNKHSVHPRSSHTLACTCTCANTAITQTLAHTRTLILKKHFVFIQYSSGKF